MLTLAATLVLMAWPARAELSQINDLSALLEKKYGFVDPGADPQVARIQTIFERVQDVADRRGNRRPQLHILNKTEVPWAIALPDGQILLSMGAVDLCYRNVSQAQGDTRIAFVLGHELAHLAKNDFWDKEVYQAIAKESQSGASRNRPISDTTSADLRQRQATGWSKETEADDFGFLYAGIAGYPVQTLFGQSGKPQDNFFALWSSQAGSDRALLHGLHPPPEEREAFLRERLKRLTKAIAFFRFGLRLASVGQCEPAILLFRQFLQIFPAREVYNNLGACHLQRAQQALQPSVPPGAYWMPLLFDPSSRAEPLIAGHPVPPQEGTPTIPLGLPDKTGHELELAVDYLEQAAAADAAYLPARLNLATAHFYRGDLLKARSALKDALDMAPHNRDVMGWHALVLFLDSQANGLGEAALPPLTRLASQTDAPASLLFNHAILSKKMGKPTRSQWRRLASRPTPLPERHARTACALAKISCATLRASQEKRFPWPLPVQPGTDLDTTNRNTLFAGWQVSPLGWLQEKKQGIAYRRGEEVEVLDRDGYVTMVVLKGGILGTTQTLKKKMGPPAHIRPLADGEVWNYGPRWAFLIRDGRVREAWVIHKP
ncbi:MAG: M48 family metalloprotease [Magnetococcales bacterium]|nr:M48 family metalloprotease [Magnetococcales bacterium]